MNAKALKDLKLYVTDTKVKLYHLLGRAKQKRKTDKWKACISSTKFLIMRIEAVYNILDTGGNSDDLAVGDELILKILYDPHINYWNSELNK